MKQKTLLTKDFQKIIKKQRRFNSKDVNVLLSKLKTSVVEKDVEDVWREFFMLCQK